MEWATCSYKSWSRIGRHVETWVIPFQTRSKVGLFTIIYDSWSHEQYISYYFY